MLSSLEDRVLKNLLNGGKTSLNRRALCLPSVVLRPIRQDVLDIAECRGLVPPCRRVSVLETLVLVGLLDCLTEDCVLSVTESRHGVADHVSDDLALVVKPGLLGALRIQFHWIHSDVARRAGGKQDRAKPRELDVTMEVQDQHRYPVVGDALAQDLQRLSLSGSG